MEPRNRNAAPDGQLVVMDWQRDDRKLLAALRRGNAAAAAAFFDRFGAMVNRLVWRVLGADPDHDDIVQQVFLNALDNVGRVRDGNKLAGWLMAVTINTARGEIRRRKHRRRVWADETRVAAEPGPRTDHAAREGLRRAYHLFDRMPPDERIAFILRYVEQQPLDEVATACSCSLATIKRRIKKAENRFTSLAAQDPVLAERLQTGRWSSP
jgi:RNA polymerase sigma-70 factor (ECF subfamily)